MPSDRNQTEKICICQLYVCGIKAKSQGQKTDQGLLEARLGRKN